MRLSLTSTMALAMSIASCVQTVHSFAPPSARPMPSAAAASATSSSTSLFAIGVLAKKAKEATLRQYISDGVEPAVMEKYEVMKKALADESAPIDITDSAFPTPLQDTLTRRVGTITLIAEFKRKMATGDMISDRAFDPELLSGEFREFGASAIAVMTDERMGGCTQKDLKTIVEEQRRARMEVPGPVSVINNDLIIDTLQIAQSAANGAEAAVFDYALLGADETVQFLKAAQALGLESIVSVSTKEDAQAAIDLGARMIMVTGVADLEERIAAIEGLTIPEGRTVTTIANIPAHADQGYEEIEEVWACRDRGYNVVWVNDVLYKGGADSIEHPGAIIKSMTSKSSLKWASPMVKSGRGEGAKEYLGDILM